MVTGKDSWKLVGLLLLCLLLAHIGFFALLGSFRDKLTFDFLVLLNAFALIFVLLLPTVLFGTMQKWNWFEVFRLRPTSWRIIFITVIGTFALGLTVSQLTLWLIQRLADSVIVEQSKLTNLLSATEKARFPILLIFAVMLPALPEELVFRGVIQQGFEHQYSPKLAILLTGIVFAIFHLDPIQAFSVAAIAIFWGWIAWRSQSVLPSLFAHAFQNALTVISVTLARAGSEGVWVSKKVLSVSPNWWAALLGLSVWIVSLLTLMRLLPRRGEGNGSATFGVYSDQTGTASGSR
ncbi:MAG: CPBP family intramembrane metalloprotease [Armatimonadetes bacterium]|nr:CPBP family intramembrane metalloprotease [Armatimonadota bacterium]MDW8029508.1 type II CAAX endopeptidase family protein [Armatimonadota bacterium]